MDPASHRFPVSAPPSRRFGLAAALALLAGLFVACGEQPAPPNIVLIVVDTLRADHLGCFGYPRPTSPHIDRLADRGVVFQEAAAVASYTRPSSASILTGLYPSVHGAITHADSIAPEVPTLAEKLRAAGYQTTGFYRNGNVGDKFGFGRGFDEYLVPDNEYWIREGLYGPGSRNREPEREYFVSEVDDHLLTQKAMPFLQANQRFPFFLYLHLSGPHDPYTPPPDAVTFLEEPLTPAAALFYRQPVKPHRQEPTALDQLRTGRVPLDEATRRQTVALYDAEVAFSDRQIGAVLDTLEERGLLDDTVVLVTSDHGEELWDHGDLGHGHSNYQELLHVPLVVAGPGIRHRRVTEPVSLIDLMPTVLELAGLEPAADLPGESLAPVLRGRQPAPEAAPIYAEGLLRFQDQDPIFYRSFQRGRFKLMLDFQRHRKLLFDLGNDPGETSNLVALEPEKTRELLSGLIRVHHRNLRSPYLAPIETADIPAELETQLRALGYVGKKSDSDASSDLFRRPLGRSVDLDPYGFLGLESDGAGYLQRIVFPRSDYPEEQLLYGWKDKRASKMRVASRAAGVRLGRGGKQTRWRIEGHVLSAAEPPGPFTLEVRIDGGEAQRFDLPAPGQFDVSGPLPAGGSTVRFDLECDATLLIAGERRSDEHAPCLRVRSIGLE